MGFFKGVWVFFSSIYVIIAGTLALITCILGEVAEFFYQLGKEAEEATKELEEELAQRADEQRVERQKKLAALKAELKKIEEEK